MRVQTLEDAKTDIREADFQELRTSFRGRLILPSDPQFDDARRVWNGTIDRRPALIGQCSGAADVIAAVKFAADRRLLVAVRGGGHSIPGHSVCDGGLVIDLSTMRGVLVDPRQRTVRATEKWPSRLNAGSVDTIGRALGTRRRRPIRRSF